MNQSSQSSVSRRAEVQLDDSKYIYSKGADAHARPSVNSEFLNQIPRASALELVQIATLELLLRIMRPKFTLHSWKEFTSKSVLTSSNERFTIGDIIHE